MLDLARETVAMDTMAQRFGKKFYQNGARLSGVVEVDTDTKPGGTPMRLKRRVHAATPPTTPLRWRC